MTVSSTTEPFAITHRAEPRTELRIDFVSDVVCPWCAVGLAGLEQALDAFRMTHGATVDVQLHVQPFELNPTLGPAGVASAPYLKAKYGLTDEQLQANAQRIAERGAQVGFAFGVRRHVWNSFDAHRLLAWAASLAEQPPPQRSAQHRLKRALLQAYHGECRNISEAAVLLDLVREVGLDARAAQQVLAGDDHAQAVREAEQLWASRGVTAVPAAVINDQFVIAGGQPPAVYLQALEQIAAKVAQPVPSPARQPRG
jgi:predicted DsbA family dithiol-disulfide isomerase